MSKPVRLVLIIVGALVAIVVLGGVTAFALGGRVMSRTMTVAGEPLDLPTDSAALARGEHLVTIWGCNDCHAANLGGKVMIAEPAFATLAAPNLTSGAGGIGASYTVQDFERAIRHGVAKNRRVLMIMPSAEYNLVSDRDVASIIAYVRSQPPVDNAPEGRKLGPIGRMVSLMAAGALFPALAIEHDRPHRDHIEPAVTAEYGGYLASACKGCHGPDFTGAAMGGDIGPNLTPDSATGIGGWTFDDFTRAFQQGRVPDGSTLDSAMPWYVFATMTDDEVQALWMFLSTLEPKEGVARRAATP